MQSIRSAEDPWHVPITVAGVCFLAYAVLELNWVSSLNAGEG
jgi:hypothetical protein